MARPERVVHEEVTRLPLWAVALVWAPCLIAAYHLFPWEPAGGEATGARGLAQVTALLAVPGAVHLLFGRLRVRVTRTSLCLDFGYTGLISRMFGYGEIVAMEAVRYSPLREFGGWGIRYSFKGRKRAWTMSGNRALVLDLADGRRFYVGSSDPERLAERILLVADIPLNAEDAG